MTIQADDGASDAPLASGAEGKAQTTSELDTLLSEFKNTTSSTKELEPVIQFAKGEMTRKAQETRDGDIATAVGTIQEAGDGALKDVNPKLIEGLMETYAKQDPGFVKAFEERGKNPKGWQDALVDGGKYAIDLLGDLPQNKDRDDLEAAKAAVDGTSDSTPSKEGPSGTELMAMTDQEFENSLNEDLAKAS